MHTVCLAHNIYFNIIKKQKGLTHAHKINGKRRIWFQGGKSYLVKPVPYLHRHREDDDFILIPVEGLQQFLEGLHLATVLCAGESHEGCLT